jgi:hypothetical protein
LILILAQGEKVSAEQGGCRLLYSSARILLLFDLDNLNMHSFEPAVHLSAFVHEALMPLLSYLGQERLPF